MANETAGTELVIYLSKLYMFLVTAFFHFKFIVGIFNVDYLDSNFCTSSLACL